MQSGLELCPRRSAFSNNSSARILAASIVLILAGVCRGQSGPLEPAETASRAILPEGFSVSVFAAEPDVRQPIAFCVDDRGRLWVAEAYNYPHHGTRPGDRILILEDVDNDGRFDKRTIFYDKLNYVTGIEVGFGGVWVMSPPYFYFIADRDGDDRPDGEPQLLLDGFGNHANAHNLANGFSWGPDGWLYGTHGRTNWSLPGRPGTPQDQRVQFDGGVYRYHPVRHVWESFCDGTTNPWGVDFDDFGQAFVSNIGPRHLYHAIQGAHYEPWRNRQSSQYAYQRIPTIADHHHWPETLRRGTRRDRDRRETGEDHAGVLIYLGDSWPKQYRNTVFMCNLHGRAINNDLLFRKGSGYTASHGPDLVSYTDPWFVGVTLRAAPDGSVYVSDWSETGECHFRSDTQRQTGRIYKISYGKRKASKVDIARLSDQQLVQAQLHNNDWHVRHARRVLQERAAAGHDMSQVRASLVTMFQENPDVTRKLRALWALHVIGELAQPFLFAQLDHPSEYVRAWAVRLLTERTSSDSESGAGRSLPRVTAAHEDAARRQLPGGVLEKFQQMAMQDPSAFVRLHLASAVLRLPLADRWAIGAGLVSRAEDGEDANLPLMVWYGIQPLVTVDTPRALQLLGRARIPLVRQFIARRAASGEGSQLRLEQLVRFLSETDDLQIQLDVLEATGQALRGRRDLQPPRGWSELYTSLSQSANAEVLSRSLRLGILFRDTRAMASMRDRVMDPNVTLVARRRGLGDLVEQKDPDLLPLLYKLIDRPNMRAAAIRGLAAYDHPGAPEAILSRYSFFNSAEKQSAISTLASRPASALDLLDAIDRGQVSRGDIRAATVRQMQEMSDQKLDQRLAQVWGVIRSKGGDKTALIQKHKNMLTAEVMAQADLRSGRTIYARVCGNCHRLFGEGGTIGPDITGSNRSNLDYILENILDPSALVERAYQLSIVQTEDGRVVSGILAEQTDARVTIQTPDEQVFLSKSDIETMKLAPISMMPEGLFDQLSDAEIRDLIAYLASSTQMPHPRHDEPTRD